MNIKFFPDTDSALFEFSEGTVEETVEINQNIYIELDKNGNLVSMTIEHARKNTGLSEFSYQEIAS